MNDQITRLSDFPSRQPLFQARKLVWYLLSVIQTLLVLRFILKLFAANPTGGVTNLIYSITNFAVYPFTTVLGPGTVGGSSFEWTTLLAIIAYLMLAIAVNKLLTFGRPGLSRIEQARMLSIEKYSR